MAVIVSTSDSIGGFSSVMSNDDITLKAKGLFALLFSREGEHVTLERLLDSTAESAAAVRGAIKELEGAGYLDRIRKTEGGHASYDWILTI